MGESEPGVHAAPPRPLRIALALESSGPGGAEQVLLRLGTALRTAGHDVMIATLRPGWMTERAEGLGFPVHVLPQQPGLDPLWIPRFARLLRRERVDVLHSHEFAMNVHGGIAARLAGCPHVATLHSALYVADRPVRRAAYRALLRAGLRLVAVSRVLADELSRRMGIERERIAVVPNGVPIPEEVPATDIPASRSTARRALGLDGAGRLLVAVGNLYPVKDHATLIRALARLPDDVHAAIAGRGDEEQTLRELSAELGLTGRVHLLGVRDDVDRVLRAGDLFVHPSLSEGLPLAVLEAMAAGLAVVATRVGGIPEAVVDGETGRLVPSGEPEALGDALRELLDEPERAARMGAAGRARTLESFSMDRMRAGYGELYTGAAQR